jgi:putative endonuclease
MNRKETGARGEWLAVPFLVRKGFKIIETNFRCREGEVDIIAQKDGYLVFVEVRTKRSRRYGTPEESITETKKAHLRAVASRYYESHPGLPENWRIDVVAVELNWKGDVQRIGHVENAVEGE